MTLYRAETATLTVAEGGSYTSSVLSVTVSGAALASFTIPTPASQTAGAAFTVSITAKDGYGNTATYAGSQCLAFSGPATSPGGIAPAYPAQGACAAGKSAVTFTAGVAAGVGITLANASASTTLTVTDAGKTGTTGAFTVGVAALNRLALAAASTTPAAGATDALTITAVDLYGNTVTTYTGAHTLTFSGAGVSGSYTPTVTSSGGGAVNFGSGTAISFTAGVATASGSSNGVMTLYRAETATLTVAEGGSYTSSVLSVTVHLPAGLGLKIQYYNRDPLGTNKEWIYPGLKLFNTGSVSVTLSQVDVRYWFTRDSGASTFQTACNSATVGCSNLTYDSTAFTPTRPGANSYLHVGFLGAAGSLGTGAATEVLTGVAQTDWSTLVETNDYSYGTNTTYADTTKVTAYVYGNLVWGVEP
jgi:hypothetical protein